jgi:predicted nucleic acid-binding Zn ribbon protein
MIQWRKIGGPMESLRRTASQTLRHLLESQPTTAGKVLFAWHVAVGPGLARATTTQWSDDGTLRVRARNAAWLRELRHARPMITARLAELLGPDVVRRIEMD